MYERDPVPLEFKRKERIEEREKKDCKTQKLPKTATETNF